MREGTVFLCLMFFVAVRCDPIYPLDLSECVEKNNEVICLAPERCILPTGNVNNLKRILRHDKIKLSSTCSYFTVLRPLSLRRIQVRTWFRNTKVKLENNKNNNNNNNNNINHLTCEKSGQTIEIDSNFPQSQLVNSEVDGSEGYCEVLIEDVKEIFDTSSEILIEGTTMSGIRSLLITAVRCDPNEIIYDKDLIDSKEGNVIGSEELIRGKNHFQCPPDTQLWYKRLSDGAVVAVQSLRCVHVSGMYSKAYQYKYKIIPKDVDEPVEMRMSKIPVACSRKACASCAEYTGKFNQIIGTGPVKVSTDGCVMHTCPNDYIQVNDLKGGEGKIICTETAPGVYEWMYNKEKVVSATCPEKYDCSFSKPRDLWPTTEEFKISGSEIKCDNGNPIGIAMGDFWTTPAITCDKEDWKFKKHGREHTVPRNATLVCSIGATNPVLLTALNCAVFSSVFIAYIASIVGMWNLYRKTFNIRIKNYETNEVTHINANKRPPAFGYRPRTAAPPAGSKPNLTMSKSRTDTNATDSKSSGPSWTRLFSRKRDTPAAAGASGISGRPAAAGSFSGPAAPAGAAASQRPDTTVYEKTRYM